MLNLIGVNGYTKVIMNSSTRDLGIRQARVLPADLRRSDRGTCDRSATLRLLEITRQPDLASCCTWSISTAGVPHKPPHTTTGSTNLVTKPTTPTNSTTRHLKDFMAACMSGSLNSLCPSGMGQLVHGGGELLQLCHNLVHRGGEEGVHLADGHERYRH